MRHTSSINIPSNPASRSLVVGVTLAAVAWLSLVWLVGSASLAAASGLPAAGQPPAWMLPGAALQEETDTPTPADTPTASETLTPPPSSTPSPAVPPSNTLTPSNTPTPTTTLSATPSATNTRTPTVTRTPTNTGTATPTPVLLAQWLMDEGAGTQVGDSSPSGAVPGTLGSSTNRPVWTEHGVSGAALQFDGNDFATFNNHANLRPTHSFTVAAWIYPTALGSTPRTILVKSSARDYSLWLDKDGYLEFFMADLTPQKVRGPVPPLNTWTYVVGTYDVPSGQIKLYVNGLLVAADTFTGTVAHDTASLRIGANLSGGQGWHGRIDQVEVHSRALPDSEIMALYQAVMVPAPTATPTRPPGAGAPGSLLQGLVSYWELEEQLGQRFDSHGGNHLTSVNSAGYQTGINGTAADLEYDSRDHLKHADNDPLSVLTGESISMSAWVRFESLGAYRQTIIGKADTSTTSTQEFLLLYEGSLNRFIFKVIDDTGTGSQVSADTFGAAQTDVWYFVAAWYDHQSGELGIQINEVADTISYSGGIRNGPNEFRLGHFFSPQHNHSLDGLIDQVGVWKRALSPAEREGLYNSGYGLSYAALQTAAEDWPTPVPTTGPTATGTPGAGALLQGLVAYWQLDEITGQREDAAGSSHLADNNTVEQQLGKLGWAADFSASSSEWLAVADSAAISVAGHQNKAWAGWLHIGEFTGDWMTVLSKWSSSSAEYRISINPANKRLYFYAQLPNNSAAVNVSNPMELEAGAWYFVYVYHNADADQIGISVNGGPAAAKAHNGGIRDGVAPLNLGRLPTSGHFFSGQLDDWAIWDRVLAPEEIAALYNQGQGLTYPLDGTLPPTPTPTPEPQISLNAGLQAYWGLDETGGQRQDAAASNHLMDNNTVQQAIGLVNYAASFSAAGSEWLGVADSAAVSVAGHQSKAWAGWLKIDGFTDQWMTVLSKWSGSSVEYRVTINPSNRRLYFYAQLPDNTASVSVASTVVLEPGIWYFVYIYHDEHNDEIGVSINNGAFTKKSHSLGIRDGTASLNLGRLPTSGHFFNGQLDEWAVWNRPLAAYELAYLYNQGAGRGYPFEQSEPAEPLPSSSLLDELAAYWHLDEAGGQRGDAAGDSHLADNNTVEQAAGHINYAADFSATSSEWLGVADSAAVSVAGHQSKAWAGWLKIDGFTDQWMTVLSKWSASSAEYRIMVNHSNKRLYFYAQLPDNSASVNVSNPLELEAGVWYFVYVYHDEHNDEIGISLNNGAVTKKSHNLGIRDGTASLSLGRLPTSGHFFNGQLDEWAIWGRALTTGELAYLYNNGLGRSFPFNADMALPSGWQDMQYRYENALPHAVNAVVVPEE